MIGKPETSDYRQLGGVRMPLDGTGATTAGSCRFFISIHKPPASIKFEP
jgi:hypothetical protein